MATVQTLNKMKSNLKVLQYDHDPADSTVATDVSGAWFDMRDYSNLMVTTFASALTGDGVTAFKLVANTASDGTGTEVDIVAHAVGTAPDAVGDWLVLECSAEQISSLGDNLRYVNANITCDNAADEQVVTFIAVPKHCEDGLTADVIA